jgi:WG containing repeat
LKFADRTLNAFAISLLLLLLLLLAPPAHAKVDVEKRINTHGVIFQAPITAKWIGWIEGTDQDGLKIRTKKESNDFRLVCCMSFLGPLESGGMDRFRVTRLFKDDVEGKKGFVDATGKVIVDPKYKWAESFYHGLAPVREDKGMPWRLIDKQGNVKYTLPIDITPSINNCFFGVSKDDFLSVRKGPQDTAQDYLSGVAGLFDLAKMQFFPTGEFGVINEPSEGLSLITGMDGHKDGYVDSTGRAVIAPQFESASSFSESLAAVVKDRRRGYIDHSGKMVFQLPIECSDAESFHEGLAAVAMGGEGDASKSWKIFKGAKWGFVDKTGKLVIPATFYVDRNGGGSGPAFCDGLANVAVGDELTRKYGFIDKSGRWKIEPQFKQASAFENGFATVTIGDNGFNREDWNRRRGVFIARADNFHMFLLQHGLIGMSRKAVIDLLGRADKSVYNDDIYTLISSDCANAYKGVQIHYDGDKVTQFRYNDFEHGGGPWRTQPEKPDQPDPSDD